MEKLSKRDRYYFKKAYEISNLSDFPKIHIGCIAVYKKKMIGIGYNQAKTNPIQAKYNVYRGIKTVNDYIHAEMACINQIKNLDIDFSKVKLFVYREDAEKNIRICRPCEACERAIRDLGITKVYYTDTNKYVREDYI